MNVRYGFFSRRITKIPVRAKEPYSNFRITIITESRIWLSYPYIRPATTDSRFTAESTSRIRNPHFTALFR